MGADEQVRLVTPDELRKRRSRLPRGHQRGIATKARILPQAHTVGDDAAVMTVPVAQRITPRETYDHMVDYLLKWSRTSRLDYMNMVRMLRTTNPWQIAHLTDEQAADMLEDGARRKAEESVKRVYRRLGREHELQIIVGGY